MTSKLRGPGLALVAVVAIGALAAQGALAEPHELEVTKAPAVLTGENEGNAVFETKPGGVKLICKKVTGTATVETEISTSGTAIGSATECSSPVGAAILINEGCQLTIKAGETTQGPTEGVSVLPGSLVCEEGGQTRYTSGGCTITVTNHSGETPVNQNIHGGRVYNIGTPPTEELTAEVHLTGVHYVASGANCVLLGIKTGTATSGTLQVNMIGKAYKDGFAHTAENQVGVRVIGAPSK